MLISKRVTPQLKLALPRDRSSCISLAGSPINDKIGQHPGDICLPCLSSMRLFISHFEPFSSFKDEF